jgi:hypothetical protein
VNLRPVARSTGPRRLSTRRASAASPAEFWASPRQVGGVPRDDPMSRQVGDQGAQRKENAERDQLLSSGERERHEHHTAQERGQEHGQQHALPTDKGPDHRHHLDVASAHGVLLEDPATHRCHYPKESKPDPGAEQRRPKGRPSRGKCEEQADDQAAETKLVGDDIGAGVGDGDAQQDGQEDCAAERLEADPMARRYISPDKRGDRLDQGILHRDRNLAATTAAPEQQPGNHRNVLVPRQRASAVGATRARAHHRLLWLRAPTQDADIEEAADDRAQDGGEGDHDGRCKRRVSGHA